MLEERIARTKKSVLNKDYLDSLDSFHTSQMTPKQQEKVPFD